MRHLHQCVPITNLSTATVTKRIPNAQRQNNNGDRQAQRNITTASNGDTTASNGDDAQRSRKKSSKSRSSKSRKASKKHSHSASTNPSSLRRTNPSSLRRSANKRDEEDDEFESVDSVATSSLLTSPDGNISDLTSPHPSMVDTDNDTDADEDSIPISAKLQALNSQKTALQQELACDAAAREEQDGACDSEDDEHTFYNYQQFVELLLEKGEYQDDDYNAHYEDYLESSAEVELNGETFVLEQQLPVLPGAPIGWEPPKAPGAHQCLHVSCRVKPNLNSSFLVLFYFLQRTTIPTLRKSESLTSQGSHPKFPW